MRHALIVAALLATGPTMAVAGEIYRCGPAANSYSHMPCDHGRRIVLADDTPTDDQREQSRSLAEGTAARGAAMQRDRLAAQDALASVPGDRVRARAPSKADRAPAAGSTIKDHRLRAKAPARPKLAVIRPVGPSRAGR